MNFYISLIIQKQKKHLKDRTNSLRDLNGQTLTNNHKLLKTLSNAFIKSNKQNYFIVILCP